MKRFPAPRAQGFTTIEFLIAVVLMAILVGASLPFFLATIQRSRFDSAVRRIASELRRTQSLAVTTSSCYGLHIHSSVNGETAYRNQFRVERGPCTSAVGWPSATATIATDPNVITNWGDLGQEFPGIQIATIVDNSNTELSGVAFTSRGMAVNPFVPTFSPPVTITVTTPSGTTRGIQVLATGSVRVL